MINYHGFGIALTENFGTSGFAGLECGRAHDRIIFTALLHSRCSLEERGGTFFTANIIPFLGLLVFMDDLQLGHQKQR